MRVFECDNFTEILDKRSPDFPQVIVAGWCTPSGQMVGAQSIACDVTPSVGQIAASLAACAAACFKRLDEIAADDPKLRDQVAAIVDMAIGGYEVVQRMKNDLVTPAALAGARQDSLFD